VTTVDTTDRLATALEKVYGSDQSDEASCLLDALEDVGLRLAVILPPHKNGRAC
jgi:hypothetical protein